jgi:hypothetical protein
MEPAVFVHEATLELQRGADPRSVGAEVTRTLCGHWKHEGPCRWPHNNDIDSRPTSAVFRTIFVSAPEDETDVRGRIDETLAHDGRWRLIGTGPRRLRTDEQELAERLRHAPRL